MPLKRPTTTPVPDEIFDEWLAILGDAELRVLLYIVRRTFGFDKRTGDTISYTQFTDGITARDGRVLDRGCGVRNRTNVAKALRALEGRGIIRRVQRHAPEGDAAVTFYVLWFEGDAARDDDPRDRAAVPAAQPTRRLGRTSTEGGGTAAALPGTATALPGAVTALPRTATAPRGGTATALRVVPQQYPQLTDRQETEKQETDTIEAFEGSTHPGDVEERETLRRIIADFSRELGDAAHEEANLTRAVNLWRRSGLSRAAFFDLLYEAKRRTRKAQGQQPPGRRIEATAAYYFVVLTQLVKIHGADGAARDPPGTPATGVAGASEAETRKERVP
jgi:hypothetical protein